MPRFHPLQSVAMRVAPARRLARLREWMMEPTPSPLPALTERDHALRPWIAALALLAFLGSQCLMPGLLMMDAARAGEQQTAWTQTTRATANASQPAPIWYGAAQRRAVQRREAMREESARLVQAVQDAPREDEEGAQPALKNDLGSIEGPKAAPSALSGCKGCEVEMKALDLSRPPTEKELRRAGQLGGALSPIAPADFEKLEREQAQSQAFLAQQGRGATAAEQAYLAEKAAKIQRLKDVNLSFGVAIQEWNKHNFQQAAQLFEAHLKQYPDSPWAGEAQLHLGCDAKYNGRFSEAEAIYNAILQNTSGDKKSMSFDVHQKSKARWADLDLARGRLDDAAAKLRNVIATDTDWRRITWAQSWLGTAATYKANARDLRACGTAALSYVMASLGKRDAADQLARIKPSGSQGFTLAELEKLAQRYGAPMRGFKATPEQLAALPMPLIVHYDFGGTAVRKPQAAASTRRAGATSTRLAASPFRAAQRSGHFLVVKKVNARQGVVEVYDPQERRLYEMKYRDLAREWSGTGLLLTKSDEASRSGARRLSQAQMKTIIGGCCGTYSAPPGNGGDGLGTGDDGDEGGGGGSGDNGDIGGESNNPPLKQCKGSCPPYGSPAISINMSNLNTVIQDIPMWYRTTIGPDVEITMTYNAQDALTQASPFGNKWTFNYASYLVEDTAAGGGRVTVFRGDGSQHNYTPDGNGGYLPPAGVHNTLTKQGTNSYVITTPGGGKRFYQIPAGTNSLQPFLVEARDRFGYSLKFIYNSNVKLIKIKDAQDKITNLTYDAQGHIVRITDPFARAVSFSYDVGGNMIEAADMAGQAFQYSYDANKYVTRLNTAQGAWLLAYQPGYPDNDLTMTDPMGGVEKYHWNAWGNNRYSYTDKRNNVTGFTVGQVVGGIGKITAMNHPDGTVTSTQYDAVNGGPTRLVDERGKATTLTYNAQGKVKGITDAKGQQTSFTYSGDGLKVKSTVNALGQTPWTAEYNDLNQLKTITNAANQSVVFTYKGFGGIETATYKTDTGFTDHIDSYNYDPNTRQLLSVSRGTLPNNGVTLASYTYDVVGRVQTVTDPSNLTVSYTYNNLDQVTRTTYPDGTYEAADYLCCSVPSSVTDRSGRKSYFDYDALLRLTRVQDAAANSVQYNYDATGNVTALTDSRGIVTRWSYDAMNRPLRKTYDDATYSENGYAQGLLTQTRGTRGQIVNYSYDDNANLTLVNYANPNMADIGYAYDALDRLAQMTDGLGTTTYGYDVLSRPTSVNGPFVNDTVGYGYDDAGRPGGVSVQNSNGTSSLTNYGYDAMGRMRIVKRNNLDLEVWGISYSGSSDRVSEVHAPNGTSNTFSYDSLHRLTQARILTGNVVQSRYTYTLDNAKSIRTALDETQGSNPPRHVGYSYDVVDQLTGEAQSEATLPSASTRNQSYVYDAMGNRSSRSIAQSVNGGAASTTSILSTHNRLNQLTAQSVSLNGVPSSTSSFAYDASGNLTAQSSGAGGSTYLYDDADRLVSLTQKDPTSGVFSKKSEFVYDGQDRKVISREYSWNTQTSSWTLTEEKRRVYDGMEVMQERDGNNVTKVNYVRAGNVGGLLGRVDSSGSYYYSYDGSGNVVSLTDANKQLVAEYAYDAYGNTLRATGAMAAANTYHYSTKELHAASGLYDYGFRFYSPGMGRWINRDPIAESGGLNLYAMVGNNPVNSVDAYGLYKLAEPSTWFDGNGYQGSG